MMNWLYLKESKRYINMTNVSTVCPNNFDAGGGVWIYFFGGDSDSELLIGGDDADKILEYLEKVAYA